MLYNSGSLIKIKEQYVILFCEDVVSVGALIEGASLSPKTGNSLSSMAAEKLALGSDRDYFWVTVSRTILIQYNLIQFPHFGLLPCEAEAPEHHRQHIRPRMTSRLCFATSNARQRPQKVHPERSDKHLIILYFHSGSLLSRSVAILLAAPSLVSSVVVGQKMLYCGRELGTSDVQSQEEADHCDG